ncbi:MAG: hypothetical protein ABJF50_02270 [Paracoccaceae bacterium]
MSEYLGTLGSFQLIGVVGFVVYVFAFGRVQFGWLDGNSATYSALNVLAASLVAISLFAEFNLSSALIQGSWIIIGLVGILKRRAGQADTSVPSQRSSDAQKVA